MDKKELITNLYTVFEKALSDKANFADIDFLLDERDKDIFARQWTAEYSNIEKIKSRNNEKLIDKYREKIFKTVFKQTDNDDLAAYVSDDFGLLADALNSDYRSRWIEALQFYYINGKIPKGNILK